MQHKKKNRKTFKIILIILLVILIIAIATIAIINIFKPIDALNGTFVYGESVKYEFNGNGNWAMYDRDTKYPYTYSIEENILKLDFEDDFIRDASYTFSIENNLLTLIGGEGTTGGEYTLERESE